ncbi:MAG TPA: energy transducer TonB [Terriglobales bacterium]|jgi:TonB family protein|nr:energy transducer TonB [Terriglobales bacterium]
MPFRKLCLLVLIASASITARASISGSPLQVSDGNLSLAIREHQIWTSAVHDSQFAAVPHTTARTSCAAAQPPQALATPNPLLDQPEPNAKITVSFIIGADGLVHSPLILESAGGSEDRTVLNAVRSWRYRPAMCNGVPTEAEGKIEFSSR